ncbi:hypothetical protein FPQ18DRAFT_305820 [Pyronema domesticum]|nr:hypothetical protein FPQ18DRAFT_305820 [Pyronema domesticum]
MQQEMRRRTDGMTLKVEDFSNSKGIEENTNVHAVIREEIGARGCMSSMGEGWRMKQKYFCKWRKHEQKIHKTSVQDFVSRKHRIFINSDDKTCEGCGRVFPWQCILQSHQNHRTDKRSKECPLHPEHHCHQDCEYLDGNNTDPSVMDPVEFMEHSEGEEGVEEDGGENTEDEEEYRGRGPARPKWPSAQPCCVATLNSTFTTPQLNQVAVESLLNATPEDIVEHHGRPWEM